MKREGRERGGKKWDGEKGRGGDKGREGEKR